jgi:hypothetical protein
MRYCNRMYMHPTNIVAIWIYCHVDYSMQYVVLSHTLFCDTRCYCHVNYFIAMDIITMHKPSRQIVLFLRTMLHGSRLNAIATQIISWQYVQLPRELFCGSMTYYHIYCFIAKSPIAMHIVLRQLVI